MNREEFFARTSSTREITLSDGHTLKIRKLKQADVETITRQYSTESKALDGFRYIVSRCVVDAVGNRVFSDEDQARLADVSADDIKHIAEEVIEFSGLNSKKA
jgi:hypothetical protein